MGGSTVSLADSTVSVTDTTVTAPIGDDDSRWVLYAIIGGSIGGALLCCLVAGLAFVCFKRRRENSASKGEVGLVPIDNWPSANASQPVGNYAIIPRSLNDSAGSGSTLYGNPPELDSCRDEPNADRGANPAIHYAAVDFFPLPRENPINSSVNSSINYSSAVPQPVGYGTPEFVSARAEAEEE
jgi:hypothetical protein